MADAPNTVATLNGLYKEVYADGHKVLIPEGTKVQEKIKFSSKEKQLGNSYHVPVLLAYEQGFTFAAESDGAYTLNDAAAGVMKDATVGGTEILLRAQMAYSAAAKSAKGRNAFLDGTSLLFESMQKSMRKKLEVVLLYGQSGIGTISAVNSNTFTITTAEWAPGIWAGSEGMAIDVYNGSTLRDSCKVVSVDIDARTVTVDAAPSGSAASDTLYFKGAYGKEMAGIHKVLTNTGSLFGISAATYTLWKSSSYAAGGALDQAKVNAAIAGAVGKGLDGELFFLVNPKTWGNLLSNQAALTRNAGKDVKSVVTAGSKSIELFSQNGKVVIEPSIYVKEGHAFGLSLEQWKRVGAQDVSFNTPGSGEGEIFFHLPTKAGIETRCYTNQAIFCEAPGKNLIVTGIVNS